jgi:hypothetical protein
VKIGNYIVIAGAILSILPIFLFYMLPDVIYFWGVNTNGFPSDLSVYLGGFYSGAYSSGGGPLSVNLIESMEITMLCISFLIVGGFVAMLIGGVSGKRSSSLGGGFFLLFGLVILMGALLDEIGIFGELTSNLSLVGRNLLFGSLNQTGVTITWGLGIGFYLTLIGGVLGLIGSIMMEKGERVYLFRQEVWHEKITR